MLQEKDGVFRKRDTFLKKIIYGFINVVARFFSHSYLVKTCEKNMTKYSRNNIIQVLQGIMDMTRKLFRVVFLMSI